MHEYWAAIALVARQSEKPCINVCQTLNLTCMYYSSELIKFRNLKLAKLHQASGHSDTDKMYQSLVFIRNYKVS